MTSICPSSNICPTCNKECHTHFFHDVGECENCFYYGGDTRQNDDCNIPYEFQCGCKTISIDGLERCEKHKNMDEENKDKIYIPNEDMPF